MTKPVAGPQRKLKRLRSALLRYRIMAFTTGVVLILGCVMLVLQNVLHVHHVRFITAIVWVAHGYLFLVYVGTALDLGLKLRFPWLKLILVMAAGTIPTMSFVAEHFVTRDVRAEIAKRDAALRTASADETAPAEPA